MHTPIAFAAPAPHSETLDVPVVDLDLKWTDGLGRLDGRFHTRLPAQPLSAPYWVAGNRALAREIGLDPGWFDRPEGAEAFAGCRPVAGTRPLASVYSGHQFGVWAGQLGDGRALLLGAVRTPAGDELELQFKGSGRTPYSRMGDGRAVLRSSIREYLCSEAMHGLGIPTTRALALVGSDAPVIRESVETAAVVTRVAPSFIRFGHFEHFSFNGEIDALRVLADEVIDRFYPECREATGGEIQAGNPYAALLRAVTQRTAVLIARWQAVGFCHGVMNTDNMSILGLTIDYGPFQFMDGFDPRHVCNHSDTLGRYAWGQQPNIAFWNLTCLGQALLPLIGDAQAATQALEPFRTAYPEAFAARLRAKLGLLQARPDDQARVGELLRLLAQSRADWTVFWRRLSRHMAGDALAPVRDLFVDRAAFDTWMLWFQERVSQQPRGETADLMLRSNPAVVLRNHLAEQAIQRATQGDFAEIGRLSAALARPFEEPAGHDDLTTLPPDWAAQIAISCSS